MEDVHEDLSENKKFKILMCTVAMTFMTCLDSSIVNVALPLIAHDLHSTMAGVQWIVTSYLITIAVLILLCGRIGDIKGKVKVFKIGVLIFTIGSILSGLSKSLPLLICSRVIQGTGASCTMAVGMGIISKTYSNNGRAKALGISSSAVALGTMIGPALGGMIASIRWDLIFWINVPIGIIAFISSTKVLPENDNSTDEKIDFRGTIVFAVFIVSLILSVTEGEFLGYTNKIILLGFLISILSFLVFIYLQKTVKSPVLDLTLFKNKLFIISVGCGFFTFVAVSCQTILLPFYLQDSLNISPFYSGLFLIIYPLVLGITSPISGDLADKLNPELISTIGTIFLALGFLLMGIINEGTPLWYVGVYNAIMGIGNGMFKSSNNSLVMARIPKEKLGIAGSVNSLFRNVGMTFGFTLATTLLYDRMSKMLGYKVSNYIVGKNYVFISAMTSVFKVAAIMCFISVILSIIRYKKYKNNQL